MASRPDALHAIPDDDLLRRLGELVTHSRRVEADLVAHIGEVEERRLYAREASPSMFAYCTERLHLSEAEAYRRITVARAARKHEVLLAMLRDGRLHLTGIALLAPLLTLENRDAVLARATHRSKRQIEELVAELSPRPDAPSGMRKLPERRKAPLSGPPQGRDQVRGTALELVPKRVLAALELAPDRVFTPAIPPTTAPSPVLELPMSQSFASGVATRLGAALAPPTAPPRSAGVEPLSPARYKVQFTASAELRDKLEKLAALMRSEVPDGDLAAIIETAVTEKLERLEAKRYAQTRAPRKQLGDTDTAPGTRHIPAAVRRAVRARDGDRCRYVDEQGRRCSARDRLEFHHRRPFGMGGDSRSVAHRACEPPRPPHRSHDSDPGALAIGAGSSPDVPGCFRAFWPRQPRAAATILRSSRPEARAPGLLRSEVRGPTARAALPRRPPTGASRAASRAGRGPSCRRAAPRPCRP